MKQLPKSWSRRFVLRVVLWLIPAAIAWSLLTPSYNAFLTTAAENLIRLTESADATRLLRYGKHHFLVTRTDLPASGMSLESVRVSDVHFPLIMLVAIFLAVPEIPWRQRLENLGWAALVSICFHIISLLFWVNFIYATQLGHWSTENYAAWEINLWGLGKHLLDLPFKLAMPLLLWATFYLSEVSGTSRRPPRS